MLPFKKILFPIDYSEHSRGAARYAEAFAGRFDAEIVIFHSVDFPHYNDTPSDMSPARKREQLESFMAKEFEYFRVERVIDQRSDRGDPALGILRVAAERHCDLIMMPTHGRGGFRRFLLGSITAKVLHDADCPVWTGAHLENAPPLGKIEFRKFLCAISAEPYAAKLLAAASEFSAEYQAELVVVHAVQTLESASHFRSKIEDAVRTAGVNATIIVERGDVAKVIACEVEKQHADMLIIGRSPTPGFLGRLRNHAYPIIRQSPCPVLSV